MKKNFDLHRLSMVLRWEYHATGSVILATGLAIGISLYCVSRLLASDIGLTKLMQQLWSSIPGKCLHVLFCSSIHRVNVSQVVYSIASRLNCKREFPDASCLYSEKFVAHY